MSKSGMNMIKEHTKIRQQINRSRRHLSKKILRTSHDDSRIPAFKGTEGWETW